MDDDATWDQGGVGAVVIGRLSAPGVRGRL